MLINILNISQNKTSFHFVCHSYRVATLPGNLENPWKTGIWQFRQKNLRKTWNFKQKSLKKSGKTWSFNNFHMFSCKISIWLKKSIILLKKICHHQNIFLLKNIFNVALQYLFNDFILFNTVSYLKLNFKLKIDPIMCTLKNLEEIWKIWKKVWKISGNPVVIV